MLFFLSFMLHTTLLHLMVKANIRPQKLLEGSEDAKKKLFSVLKGPLLNEGEFQTIFKAINKFTCAMNDAKWFYLNWPNTVRDFLRKEQTKQKWQCLEDKLRKIDGGCLPPCFRVLQKKILWTAFVSNIWHNAFNSNTLTSLLENFEWKLV